MNRAGRLVVSTLFTFLGIGILAFGTLVGIYTVKLRRGETITGVQNHFTRTLRGSAINSMLTGELLTRVYGDDSDPGFGPAGAPIRIVEFADVECPYSAEFSQTLRKAMIAHPDKFHFTFRNFPLQDIHTHALDGALALHCANLQGKFWQMHDKLFGNQDRLTPPDIAGFGAEIGLAMDRYRSCLINPITKQAVLTDYQDGVAAGVAGTPTFFINGRKVEGSIPEKVFNSLWAAKK